MEDGIERMMSTELYNVHFLNEYKNDKLKKNEKMKKNVVKDSTTVVKDSIVKDSKEASINPQ
jgi:hypothetical protein